MYLVLTTIYIFGSIHQPFKFSELSIKGRKVLENWCIRTKQISKFVNEYMVVPPSLPNLQVCYVGLKILSFFQDKIFFSDYCQN